MWNNAQLLSHGGAARLGALTALCLLLMTHMAGASSFDLMQNQTISYSNDLPLASCDYPTTSGFLSSMSGLAALTSINLSNEAHTQSQLFPTLVKDAMLTICIEFKIIANVNTILMLGSTDKLHNKIVFKNSDQELTSILNDPKMTQVISGQVVERGTNIIHAVFYQKTYITDLSFRAMMFMFSETVALPSIQEFDSNNRAVGYPFSSYTSQTQETILDLTSVFCWDSTQSMLNQYCTGAIAGLESPSSPKKYQMLTTKLNLMTGMILQVVNCDLYTQRQIDVTFFKVDTPVNSGAIFSKILNDQGGYNAGQWNIAQVTASIPVMPQNQVSSQDDGIQVIFLNTDDILTNEWWFSLDEQIQVRDMFPLVFDDCKLTSITEFTATDLPGYVQYFDLTGVTFSGITTKFKRTFKIEYEEPQKLTNTVKNTKTLCFENLYGQITTTQNSVYFNSVAKQFNNLDTTLSLEFELNTNAGKDLFYNLQQPHQWTLDVPLASGDSSTTTMTVYEQQTYLLPEYKWYLTDQTNTNLLLPTTPVHQINIISGTDNSNNPFTISAKATLGDIGINHILYASQYSGTTFTYSCTEMSSNQPCVNSEPDCQIVGFDVRGEDVTFTIVCSKPSTLSSQSYNFELAFEIQYDLNNPAFPVVNVNRPRYSQQIIVQWLDICQLRSLVWSLEVTGNYKLVDGTVHLRYLVNQPAEKLEFKFVQPLAICANFIGNVDFSTFPTIDTSANVLIETPKTISMSIEHKGAPFKGTVKYQLSFQIWDPDGFFFDTTYIFFVDYGTIGCQQNYIVDTNAYTLTFSGRLRNSVQASTATTIQFNEYTDYFYDTQFRWLCGTPTYTLKEEQSFLTLKQDRWLSLLPTETESIGNHTLTLVVSIGPVSREFQVYLEVLPCQLESVSLPISEIRITYLMGLGEQYFNLGEPEQTPKCNYSASELQINKQLNFEDNSKKIDGKSLEIDGFNRVKILILDEEPKSTLLGINFTLSIELGFQDLNGNSFQVPLIMYLFIAKPTPDQLAKFSLQNKPPTFAQELSQPKSIPCLDSQAARQWQYVFPSASDPEMNEFTYVLEVRQLEFEGIFTQSEDNSHLTLTLDQGKEVADGKTKFKATIILKDIHDATQAYDVSFEYDCTDLKDINYYLKLLNVTNPDDQQTNIDMSPPRAFLQLSTSGELKIKFDKDLKVPKNYQTLLGLEISSEGRRLQSADNSRIKMLDIRVEYGDPDTTFDFTWEVVHFKPRELMIQLYWNAEQVSRSLDKDRLHITMNGYFLFVAQDNGVPIPPKTHLTIEIPRQTLIVPSEFNVEMVAEIILYVVVLAFLLKSALSFLLGSLLSMVRTLTLMSHMMLIDLWYPSNVQAFFGQIFVLLSFDVIPTEYFYPQFFGFVDEPYANQFSELGYQSNNVITNLGSLFLILIFQPVLMVILFAIKRIVISPDKRLYAWASRQLRAAFWNDTITLFYEPYVVLAVASFIHAQTMFQPGESNNKIFADVFNLVLLAVIISFPFAILAIYTCKLRQNRPDSQLEHNLRSQTYHAMLLKHNPDLLRHQSRTVYSKEKHKNFLDRYGVLLDGLWLRRSSVRQLRLFVFLRALRQLILASVVVFLMHLPWLTLMIFDIMQLGMVMLQMDHNWSENWRSHIRNILNELCLLAMIYIFIGLSDFVDGIDARIWTGNQLVRLGILVFVFNLLYTAIFGFAMPAFKWGFLRYRRRTLRKEKQREIKSQQAKRLKEVLEQQKQDKIRAEEEAKAELEYAKRKAIRRAEFKETIRLLQLEGVRQMEIWEAQKQRKMAEQQRKMAEQDSGKQAEGVFVSEDIYQARDKRDDFKEQTLASELQHQQTFISIYERPRITYVSPVVYDGLEIIHELHDSVSSSSVEMKQIKRPYFPQIEQRSPRERYSQRWLNQVFPNRRLQNAEAVNNRREVKPSVQLLDGNQLQLDSIE